MANIKNINIQEQLNNIINSSKRIVFFGGAGVSTESGIPDFRSKDGLYNQKYKKDPEYMLSHECFINEPEEFFQFYFDKMIFKDAHPNDCHKKLRELEEKGLLSSIITQNIDGLHQKAGSNNVLELHGNVNILTCTMCNKDYNLDEIEHKDIPKCNCGGILKPNVVLYGEPLNRRILNRALYEIQTCDTLIIGGTSLIVQPAASLIKYFRGKNLVIINKDSTYADNKANLVINDSIGKVFQKIKVINK